MIQSAITTLGLSVKTIHEVPESNSSQVRILELESGEKVVLKIPWHNVKFDREKLTLEELAPFNIAPKILEVFEVEGQKGFLLSYLDGLPIESHKEVDTHLAHEIGRYMAMMHQVERPDFGGKKSWRDLLLRNLESYQPFYEKSLHKAEMLAGYRLFQEQQEYLPDPSKASLTQFDLRLGNILVREGKLLGLIDFESSRGGSPDMDFYKIWRELWLGNPRLKAPVLEGYQSIRPLSADLDKVLPLYAIYHSLAGMVWSLRREMKDEAFYLYNFAVLRQVLKI